MREFLYGLDVLVMRGEWEIVHFAWNDICWMYFSTGYYLFQNLQIARGHTYRLGKIASFHFHVVQCVYIWLVSEYRYCIITSLKMHSGTKTHTDYESYTCNKLWKVYVHYIVSKFALTHTSQLNAGRKGGVLACHSHCEHEHQTRWMVVAALYVREHVVFWISQWFVCIYINHGSTRVMRHGLFCVRCFSLIRVMFYHEPK